LDEPNLRLPLVQAAGIARHRVGARELNRFVHDLLGDFMPTDAHILVCQLPWDTIYTTNYDTTLERACSVHARIARFNLKPICSGTEDMSSMVEDDVPYYKLQGCIERSNTVPGQLAIASEDTAATKAHTLPLLRRLKFDLTSRCLLFVGFQLIDGSLGDIVKACLAQLESTSLPLSYAIVDGFSGIEAAYWRDRYNITLVSSATRDFMLALKDEFDSRPASTAPDAARKLVPNSTSSFSRVGSSYYEIRDSDCTGASDAARFFRGGDPTWPNTRDGVAPYRDTMWEALESILDTISQSDRTAYSYLVTGAAGNGKTTMARQLLWLLSRDFRADVRCLEHIAGTPLDVRPLGQLVNPAKPQRIVILVRNAADYGHQCSQFAHDARSSKLPITIIFEERKNQWTTGVGSSRRPQIHREFELGRLSQIEIDSILDALSTHGALGKIYGLSREQQVQHFSVLADKELLVALRELTTGGSFDDIVRDEFNKIPSQAARSAYVFASAVGQVGLAIRYGTILRLLKLNYADAKTEVFAPTEGVLISHDESGSSRHNSGYQLRARHPTIASIIFDAAAPEDEGKYQILNDIISELDPGYMEDRRLLEQMAFKRQLLSTIASPDRRRAIFDRLAAIMPDNPAVLQHRSILERDLRNAEKAIHYAQEAVKKEPHSPAMINTLGMAYERAARDASSEEQRIAYDRQAEKLFSDGVRRDPSNAYGWIGKSALMKGRIASEKDATKRAELRSALITMLDDAMDHTDDAPMIAGELAEQKKHLGESSEAIVTLRKALSQKRSDSRLRDQLVRILVANNQLSDALLLANEGVNLDPTAWRLLRHVAEIREKLGDDCDAVAASYRAAIRYRQSDISMRVSLGAFLFMSGRYDAATTVFDEISGVAGGRSRDSKQSWRDPEGRERIFNGIVQKLDGPVGQLLSVPDNFRVRFFRHDATQNYRATDRVRFKVTFSMRGALANVIGRAG